MLTHGGAPLAHGGAPSAVMGSALSFLAMWVAMTAAMMAPSIAPTLWRYRQALAGAGATRAGALTSLIAAAYLVVWTVAGAIVFLLGVALAHARMLFPDLALDAPIAAGVVVLAAGGAQLTRWKSRRLSRVRRSVAPLQDVQSGAGAAWRGGLKLGRDCALACAGAMASLLAVGVMDVRAMAIATVAITAERLSPAGDRVARVIGLGAIALGSVLIARAAGLG